jgi:acyl-CoA reductase-like NAD-dependent aldehyde dehydrogenase
MAVFMKLLSLLVRLKKMIETQNLKFIRLTITWFILEQRYDHIFYTGNGAVGKIVMTAAAKHLCSVTLELGGKSPTVVAQDADLEITSSRLVWGKFFNNGQTCVAPDYVLVHKSLLKPLIAKIRNKLEKYYGSKPQASDSYGRIVTSRHFDRLKAMIDRVDAAKIAIGGETDAVDRYIAPTIVTDITKDDANLMAEEIFGPILPIIVYEELQEAVDIINSRDYPLALYIFTKSEKTANWILDRTQSGGVCINDTLMHLQELSVVKETTTANDHSLPSPTSALPCSRTLQLKRSTKYATPLTMRTSTRS